MHSSRMRTARTLTGWRAPPDGEPPPVDRQTPVKPYLRKLRLRAVKKGT